MNPIDSAVTVRVNTREYSQKARAQALIALLSALLENRLGERLILLKMVYAKGVRYYYQFIVN